MIKNLDVILVSAHTGASDYFRQPISTAISATIQKQLSDTPNGNPHKINHVAIVMHGRVYEFHLTGMRSESLNTYFDKHHDYYLATYIPTMQMPPIALLTAWAKASEWLGSVEDSPKKYDSLLCLKLLYAIKKNKLNMIKKDFDCKYICSEFVQKMLEEAIGHALSSSVMLPNDFEGAEWHTRKMRIEHV